MLKLKRLFAPILSGVLCLMCALGFAACGGSDGGDNTEQTGSSTDTEQSDGSTDGGNAGSEVTTAEVASVIISGSQTVYIGYTAELAASVVMSDGSAYGGEITWASSDESVATVTGGTVTGVAEGTANITAAAGGVTSEAYTVTVGERPSDVVDAAGWVAAMTSSDILNSMAVGTETSSYSYDSGETNAYTSTGVTTVYYELTSTADGVTGKSYDITYYDDGSTDEYYYIQEPAFMRCYQISSNSETDSCWIYESDYTGNMGMWYLQFMIADESYFGGDYFNYSEEDGAYVWEYTSGTSEYKYVVKINDGNVVYAGMFTTRTYETYTATKAVEIYYTYGGVSVTIPDDIQSKLEALTAD